MKRKREETKKNKKLKLLIACLVVVVFVVITVIYLRHGEWVYEDYCIGEYGADTYYGGGYGEIDVSSPGIYIKLSANVKNDGTMICEERETVDDLMTNPDIIFEDLNPIDRIEISGNDTQEIYISSDEYSKIAISIYTNDYAEADASVSIGRYVTNFQKFGKFLYWHTDIDEEKLEEIFDIDL